MSFSLASTQGGTRVLRPDTLLLWRKVDDAPESIACRRCFRFPHIVESRVHIPGTTSEARRESRAACPSSQVESMRSLTWISCAKRDSHWVRERVEVYFGKCFRGALVWVAEVWLNMRCANNIRNASFGMVNEAQSGMVFTTPQSIWKFGGECFMKFR